MPEFAACEQVPLFEESSMGALCNCDQSLDEWSYRANSVIEGLICQT